ncbi:hypothetical protein L198_08029 [Cryptococcus wingfieldii CBS 7118]|uniref:Uncharacterized protein n=1 Tax=Cryptococcus wingfieldii CBS 7118 TaxID=1295528 RepID=A0A1E3HLU0_9TREE|nr:hypothetical protein L198_08029 [Cryptococcus wingfieldii CBS 7118]ODN77294.1 hypothetical protein L198_08029 [Cryptococcus wingfieldii CBS 7118]
MSQQDSQEEAHYVYPDPSTLDEGNPLGQHPYYRTLQVQEEDDEEAYEGEYRYDDLEEYQYDNEAEQFQDHTGIQNSEGYSTSQQDQLTTTTSSHTNRSKPGTACPCPVEHTSFLSRVEGKKTWIPSQGPQCPRTIHPESPYSLCYTCRERSSHTQAHVEKLTEAGEDTDDRLCQIFKAYNESDKTVRWLKYLNNESRENDGEN